MKLEGFSHLNRRISPTAQAAIFRLQGGLGIKDWKPDLIIKAFMDLDAVFFAGKLRCHTTISWRYAP